MTIKEPWHLCKIKDNSQGFVILSKHDDLESVARIERNYVEHHTANNSLNGTIAIFYHSHANEWRQPQGLELELLETTRKWIKENG